MQKVNTNITKGLCFYVVLVHLSYHLVFVDVFLLLVEPGYLVMVEAPCPVWIATYFLFIGSMIFWCLIWQYALFSYHICFFLLRA